MSGVSIRHLCCSGGIFVRAMWRRDVRSRYFRIIVRELFRRDVRGGYRLLDLHTMRGGLLPVEHRVHKLPERVQSWLVLSGGLIDVRLVCCGYVLGNFSRQQLHKLLGGLFRHVKWGCHMHGLCGRDVRIYSGSVELCVVFHRHVLDCYRCNIFNDVHFVFVRVNFGAGSDKLLKLHDGPVLAKLDVHELSCRDIFVGGRFSLHELRGGLFSGQRKLIVLYGLHGGSFKLGHGVVDVLGLRELCCRDVLGGRGSRLHELCGRFLPIERWVYELS
jgi:hypothetical protein